MREAVGQIWKLEVWIQLFCNENENHMSADHDSDADLGEGLWGLQPPNNLNFLLLSCRLYSSRTINNPPLPNIPESPLRLLTGDGVGIGSERPTPTTLAVGRRIMFLGHFCFSS